MGFFWTAVLLAITAFPAIASTIVVHPQRGNDLTGNGTPQKPYRTVTHSLTFVDSPTTIVLQPGNYSQKSGESFPWVLKPGVTLQGNEAQQGQRVMVSGGAQFRSDRLFGANVAIVAQDQTEIRGLTIGNPNLQGYGLLLEQGRSTIVNNSFIASRQDGVMITGKANPVIMSNRLSGNGGSNLTIEGDAQPVIQQNILQQSKFGITIRQQSQPRLNNNVITNNENGVMVQSLASPILRGNTIEKNRQNGVIIIGDSKPDFGTTADGGKNIFRSNGVRDIHNGGSQEVSAFGNQFDQAVVFGKVAINGNVIVSRVVSSGVALPSRTNPSFTTEAVPNSVVVRISGTSPRSVGINSAIDPNLPPVTINPPSGGAIVTNTVPVRPRIPLVPLKFRVVVPVKSDIEKISVRQLLPGSFPLNRSGGEVVQVGAFNSMQLAQEQVQKLVPLGLNALVEEF